MVQGFTKEFLGQLINLKNSYLLSLSVVDLISHEDVLRILEKDSLVTGAYTFNFSDICNLVRDSRQKSMKDLEILIWEYLMFTSRALIINLYEAFKDDEERYSKVKDLDWFIFLANLRHPFSHGVDAIWDIKPYESKEVSYTRRIDGIKTTINSSWNKTPMKLDQIGGFPTILDLLIHVGKETEKFVV